MPDREKVIRAIDGCINIGDYCNDCDYDGCVFHHGSCEKDLLADALELLKEQEDLGTELTNAVELIHKKNERIEKLLKDQEAVEPILEQDSMVCGVCGHEVIWQKMLGDGVWADEQLDYCPHCGQAVKWE